jgi:2-oxo-4-hydroxy-4-carboxy-5-ureidoimidazoline decarboxylase
VSQDTGRALRAFNELTEDAARRALLACCSAPRWAAEVAGGRPYGSVAELHAAAAAALTDTDVTDGLAGHPRIGERTADPRSAREQRAVAGASESVLTELTAGNRAYEQRFGHVYLVCASGRGAEELLDVLRRRLGNDPETERGVVRGELVAINRIRLDQLLAALAHTGTPPASADGGSARHAPAASDGAGPAPAASGAADPATVGRNGAGKGQGR